MIVVIRHLLMGQIIKQVANVKKLQIAVFFDLEFLYLDGHRQTSQAVFTREKQK